MVATWRQISTLILYIATWLRVFTPWFKLHVVLYHGLQVHDACCAVLFPSHLLVLLFKRAPISVDRRTGLEAMLPQACTAVFHFRERRLCHNRRALAHSPQLICAEYLWKSKIHQVPDYDRRQATKCSLVPREMRPEGSHCRLPRDRSPVM
jgi:hypothetical protein